MKLLFAAAVMACSLAVQAQTMNDPTPIQGNMVTETARAAAMRSAMTPSNYRGQRTPAQSAARLRDLDWVKSCRTKARATYGPGNLRSAQVSACNKEFDRRREFWK